jgi:predicted dehydrogenase
MRLNFAAVLVVLVALLVAFELRTTAITRLCRILPPHTPVPKAPDALRIGLLGASGISRFALLWPASKNTAVRIVAVAARDRGKAEAFALKHGIPAAYGSYEDLLKDPSVDAVYVSVITELHFEVAKLVLGAKKHLLLEKPGTLRVSEALQLAEIAARNGVVLFEAYHYRYHPVARRVREILSSGDIGVLMHITAKMAMFDPKTLWSSEDARSNSKRASIKLLDRWCYVVDELHFLLGAADYAPLHVTNASLTSTHLLAFLSSQSLRHNHGDKAHGAVSMRVEAYKDKLELPDWNIRIYGSNGRLEVVNIGFPFLVHHLRLHRHNGSVSSEQRYGSDTTLVTTFDYQLLAFVNAVRQLEPHSSNAANLVRNALVIEEICEAARHAHFESWSAHENV